MILNSNAKNIPLAASSVDMIFTDPPYLKSLSYLYQWLAIEARRILKPGKFIAVMCGEIEINKIMRWFDDTGLLYYWLYVLEMGGKGSTCWRTNGRKNMPIGTQVKHVLVYSQGKAISRTATVGKYKSNGKDKEWHVWGQDVDSHRYWIDCFSSPGDLIVDPFAGGGTTAIACEILDRKWICIDSSQDAVNAMAARVNNSTELLPEYTMGMSGG